MGLPRPLMFFFGTLGTAGPLDRLRVLRIADTGSGDCELQLIAQLAPALTELDVSTSRSITDDGVTALLPLRQLRTLRLERLPRLTAHCLPALATLVQEGCLRSVSLEHTPISAVVQEAALGLERIAAEEAAAMRAPLDRLCEGQAVYCAAQAEAEAAAKLAACVLPSKRRYTVAELLALREPTVASAPCKPLPTLGGVGPMESEVT